MQAIRPNIRKLKSYCTSIKACNSFSDFYDLMFDDKNSKEVKGAFGENFFDQYCIEYEKVSGFTDFRPATKKEDMKDGCDAIGMTYNKLGPDQTRVVAYRQDKARKRGVLGIKDVAGFSAFKSRKSNQDAKFILCTTVRMDQISTIVQETFSTENNSWIICRDNFEATIDDDDQFFERFADRIERECKTLAEAKIREPKHVELKDFQKSAVAHVLENRKSFICLPPGSGKTVIQGEVAFRFLQTHNLLVYVAPTLTLLDQNAKKVIEYCYDKGSDFIPTFACSIKDLAVTDLEHDGFLGEEDVVCGPANSEQVTNAIRDCNKNPTIIFTTYHSYGEIVKTCKKLGKTFDRIADEALEVVPTRDVKGYEETAKDKHIHISRWEIFADDEAVNQSVCFDAFQAERNAKNEGGATPGTDNLDVFGKRFFLPFSEMKKRGTIIPLKIRALSLRGSQVTATKDYHQEGWTKDDIFNFTALCYCIDHVIQDDKIANNKIVAFLHTAGICPDYLGPITRYVRERLEYVGALISDESKNEEDRTETLDKYRAANHALIMNYGILGKGIDDDTTTVAFCARRMDHPYGMHGIHRPCRTLKSEFNQLHKEKKPCGYVYVVVDEDELGSTEQYKDLCAVFDKLYEQTGEWATDIEVVKLVESTKREDAPIAKPDREFETTPIQMIPELYNIIKVKQRETIEQRDAEDSDTGSELLDMMLRDDPSLEKSYV